MYIILNPMSPRTPKSSEAVSLNFRMEILNCRIFEFRLWFRLLTKNWQNQLTNELKESTANHFVFQLSIYSTVCESIQSFSYIVSAPFEKSNRLPSHPLIFYSYTHWSCSSDWLPSSTFFYLQYWFKFKFSKISTAWVTQDRIRSSCTLIGLDMAATAIAD